METDLLIGVLALQGAFAKHREMLTRLNIPSIDVRRQRDLVRCDGLILPGGESTTHNLLRDELDLEGFKKPLLGTCAGMIVMAQIGRLPITIERNGYGRQIASCTTKLDNGLEATFIRAPKVLSILSPDVQVLATYHNTPVWVQYGYDHGCAFHPELTNSLQIHQTYLEGVRNYARENRRLNSC